jgi:hypothetical protein
MMSEPTHERLRSEASKMKQDEISGAKGDRQEVVAVHVERDSGYGSVPGLEDEELADPAELERQVMLAEWGPILALPVDRNRSPIRPTIDENGELDFGAFDTRDFVRLHGSFDKARFKADRLQEEVRGAVIMLGVISARMPAERVNAVQAKLKDPAFDLGSLRDGDDHGFARWYLRIKRLKAEIRALRTFSWRRRVQAAGRGG